MKRIEFKGGDWPDRETSLGGMCHAAMLEFVALHIAVARRATMTPEQLEIFEAEVRGEGK